MGLGLGVEAAIEVGQVCLLESRTANRVGIVIVVDTSSGEDSAVNTAREAQIGQIQSSNDVGTDRVLFMVLTPVDIGSSGAASTVQDVSRPDLFQFCLDGFSILHTDRGHVNLLALALQHLFEVAGDPAFATPDEESRRHDEIRMDLKVRSWKAGLVMDRFTRIDCENYGAEWTRK